MELQRWVTWSHRFPKGDGIATKIPGRTQEQGLLAVTAWISLGRPTDAAGTRFLGVALRLEDGIYMGVSKHNDGL